MKTIGRTTEHNVIVEMTPEEYRLMYHLARVIGGNSDYGHLVFSSPENIRQIDLTPAFEAILESLTDSLQGYMQGLSESFMHKAEETTSD